MQSMTAVGGAFLLAGRILFAGLFVFSARGHIQRHPQYVRIATGKLPIAFLAGVPTGIYLLLASVSIAAGIWPDIGSLMIAAFVLPPRSSSTPSGPSRTRRPGAPRRVASTGTSPCSAPPWRSLHSSRRRARCPSPSPDRPSTCS